MILGPNGGLLVRNPPSGPTRELNAPLSSWALQGQWHLASTGNDNNDGLTQETALLTGAELSRRIGLPSTILQQDTTVTIHDSLADNDPLMLAPQRGGYNLRIQGIPAVLAEGALTGVTNLVDTTTRPQVVAAGFDWTPYLNRLCRITSSATAPVGTLFRPNELGGSSDTAFITRPFYIDSTNFGWSTNNTSRTLGVGDTFEVLDLPSAGDVNFPGVGGRQFGTSNAFEVQWLRLQPNNAFRTYVAGYTEAKHYACDVGASILVGTMAPRFYKCGFDSLVALTLVSQGQSNIYGACDWSSGLVFVRGGSHVFNRICMSRIQFIVETSSFNCDFQGLNGLSPIAFFNWPANSFGNGAVNIRANSSARAGEKIWGTSSVANTVGMTLNIGSAFSYDVPDKPLVSGVAGDVNFAGVITAYAGLPAVDAANLAIFGEELIV